MLKIKFKLNIDLRKKVAVVGHLVNLGQGLPKFHPIFRVSKDG